MREKEKDVPSTENSISQGAEAAWGVAKARGMWAWMGGSVILCMRASLL